MKPSVITITRDDVMFGQPTEPKYCVLACAFKKAGYENVEVFPDCTALDDKTFTNSEEMKTIIRDYDQIDLQPLEVEDEVVETWLGEMAAAGFEMDWEDYYDSDEYTNAHKEFFQRQLIEFADKWEGTEINVNELVEKDD